MQTNGLRLNLNEIINELENISDYSYRTAANTNLIMNNNTTTNLENKLIEQNRELINAIKQLSDEKLESRNLISRLEEELWSLKSKNKNEMSTLSETDKEKFKKLYFKYLRAESFRKSLVYQKRFLLIMLSGYEETEREILNTLRLEPMLTNNLKNISPSSSLALSRSSFNQQLNRNTSLYSSRFVVYKAKSRFRTAVICIIAISRIK